MFKVALQELFSDNASTRALFSSCDQLIRAHCQLIRAEREFYYQLLLAEKCDVIKQGRLVNQFATCTDLQEIPFTLTPTTDGKVVFQNSRVQLTFTSTVEGDAVCHQSPTMLLGRKFCQFIYRNPDGSREDQNEYISVGIFNVLYFSVQP